MLEVYELLIQAFQVVLAPLDVAAVQLPAEPRKPAVASADSAALRALVQVLNGQLLLLLVVMHWSSEADMDGKSLRGGKTPELPVEHHYPLPLYPVLILLRWELCSFLKAKQRAVGCCQ